MFLFLISPPPRFSISLWLCDITVSRYFIVQQKSVTCIILIKNKACDLFAQVINIDSTLIPWLRRKLRDRQLPVPVSTHFHYGQRYVTDGRNGIENCLCSSVYQEIVCIFLFREVSASSQSYTFLYCSKWVFV